MTVSTGGAWSRGQEKVDELIADGSLVVQRNAALGVDKLMLRARQLLRSAETVLEQDESDPTTSFTLAYDAAKHAGLALLGAQDLRPGSGPRGQHVAIEISLTAQFGGVFGHYDAMRRRRNDLDYPTADDEFAEGQEATRAIERARGIVEAAEKLLDQGVLVPRS